MDNSSEFKRVLTRRDTLALAFGAMVGWGWVILTGEWITRGGSLGAVAGFVLAGGVMALIGMIYAELASAMPVVGGEHAYSLRALGRGGAFACTWAIIFAYVSVCAFEAVALPTVADFWVASFRTGLLWQIAGWDVYLSSAMIGVVGSVLVTAINYIGVRPSAVVQTVVTFAIIAAGGMLVTGALYSGAAANLAPVFNAGLTGVFSVAVMAPFMFLGFDVIPQAAEEIALPPRDIGRQIFIAILLAVAWYSVIMLAVSALSSSSDLATANLATAEAAGRAFGPVGTNLLILGGIAGIITSWNAFVLAGSRAVFAMARHGMLPRPLGVLHPRFRTPHRAILIIGLLSAVAPFAGRPALVWLVDAGSFAIVIAYFMVAVSFLVLRRREPSMPRPYKVTRGRVIGGLGVAGSLGLVALYLPGSPVALAWPVEWIFVAVWFGAGGLYYLATQTFSPSQ